MRAPREREKRFDLYLPEYYNSCSQVPWSLRRIRCCDLAQTLNEEDQERLTNNILADLNGTVLPQRNDLRCRKLGPVAATLFRHMIAI